MDYKKCLEIHGYITSSDDGSDLDESKDEFDDVYQSYKPPLIEVDPTKHRIIEIGPRATAKKTTSHSTAVTSSSVANENMYWGLATNDDEEQPVDDETAALSDNYENDNITQKVEASNINKTDTSSNMDRENKHSSRQQYRKRYRKNKALKKATQKYEEHGALHNVNKKKLQSKSNKIQDCKSADSSSSSLLHVASKVQTQIENIAEFSKQNGFSSSKPPSNASNMLLQSKEASKDGVAGISKSEISVQNVAKVRALCQHLKILQCKLKMYPTMFKVNPFDQLNVPLNELLCSRNIDLAKVSFVLECFFVNTLNNTNLCKLSRYTVKYIHLFNRIVYKLIALYETNVKRSKKCREIFDQNKVDLNINRFLHDLDHNIVNICMMQHFTFPTATQVMNTAVQEDNIIDQANFALVSMVLKIINMIGENVEEYIMEEHFFTLKVDEKRPEASLLLLLIQKKLMPDHQMDIIQFPKSDVYSGSDDNTRVIADWYLNGTLPGKKSDESQAKTNMVELSCEEDLKNGAAKETVIDKANGVESVSGEDNSHKSVESQLITNRVEISCEGNLNNGSAAGTVVDKRSAIESVSEEDNRHKSVESQAITNRVELSCEENLKNGAAKEIVVDKGSGVESVSEEDNCHKSVESQEITNRVELSCEENLKNGVAKENVVDKASSEESISGEDDLKETVTIYETVEENCNQLENQGNYTNVVDDSLKSMDNKCNETNMRYVLQYCFVLFFLYLPVLSNIVNLLMTISTLLCFDTFVFALFMCVCIVFVTKL